MSDRDRLTARCIRVNRYLDSGGSWVDEESRKINPPLEKDIPGDLFERARSDGRIQEKTTVEFAFVRENDKSPVGSFRVSGALGHRYQSGKLYAIEITEVGR